jgi:hypothetical protein
METARCAAVARHFRLREEFANRMNVRNEVHAPWEVIAWPCDSADWFFVKEEGHIRALGVKACYRVETSCITSQELPPALAAESLSCHPRIEVNVGFTCGLCVDRDK